MTKSKKKTNSIFVDTFHLVFAFLIISLSLFNLAIYLTNSVPKITYSFDNEEKFWKDVIRKNPMYIDAYLELAKIDIASGDYVNARKNISNAYTINPNTKRIEKMEAVLGVMTEK